MTNINITNFRKDIYALLEQTINYNEPINISTKNGNAVVLSEEDYNSLIETLYITSVPNLKEELIKRNLNVKISIDGGIKEEVLDKIKDVDIVVSASYILNDLNNIKTIKNC